MKKDILSALPIIPEEFDAEHLAKIDFSAVRSEMFHIERLFINGLIRYYQPKNILEIGVAFGGGTINILNSINDMPESILVSIDCAQYHYRDKDILIGADVGVYSEVLPTDRWQFIIGKDPSEVIDSLGMKFDFVIMDTTHKLPGEVLTFLCIFPYLNDGAIVVLHDISSFLIAPYFTATRILFSALAGEKLFPESKTKVNNKYDANNIGAVQINSDTRKYISNVFQALTLPWYYYPARDINYARILINEHYDNVMQEYFEETANWNLNLLCPPARMNPPACKKLSSTFHLFSDNIIFYGAGRNIKTLLHEFDANGIPFNYPIWDINANDIIDIDGHKVDFPDFETRVYNSAAIITIDNQDIARAVATQLRNIGFVLNFRTCEEVLAP